METVKVKRTLEMENFISFLEKDVLKETVLSIRQFNKGASSHNYWVQTKTDSFLIKLAWKHKKEGIERLSKIIHTLSQNKQLAIARILCVNGKLFFKYQKSYGFVLEYIHGKSLPSYEMGERHFQQVLHGYSFFTETKWDDPSILLPAYDFEKMCSSCLNRCALLLKSVKNKTINYLLHQLILQLNEIQSTPLQLKEKNITVIHGDFHNNNLLFNKEKLMSFLDFEDVGLGYATEDLMRFILCLTERLPIFVTRDSYIIEWLELANKRFSFTKEEWIIGLNSFTLQKIKKVLTQIKPTSSFKQIKKLIMLLLFLKRQKHIQTLIP